MSTDLDLPLLPSAEQIRRREFATVRRGYDPDQVREYLAQMAAQVEVIEHELKETQLASAVSLPESEPQEDPYEKLAVRMSEVLRTADRKAEEILSEAGAEAGRMVAEARADADRIRVDAQAHAEEARQEGREFLDKARDESERVLSNLTTKREALVEHLQEMQAKLRGVADDLGRAADEPAPAAIDEPSPEAISPPAIAQLDQPPEVRVEKEPDLEEPEPALDMDPRYEDLWSSTQDVKLSDLFNEDEPD
jgi:DivIVA domain-containing protein